MFLITQLPHFSPPPCKPGQNFPSAVLHVGDGAGGAGGEGWGVGEGGSGSGGPLHAHGRVVLSDDPESVLAIHVDNTNEKQQQYLPHPGGGTEEITVLAGECSSPNIRREKDGKRNCSDSSSRCGIPCTPTYNDGAEHWSTSASYRNQVHADTYQLGAN